MAQWTKTNAFKIDLDDVREDITPIDGDILRYDGGNSRYDLAQHNEFGGIVVGVETFTGADTLGTDNYVALCDATSASFTLSLPTAVGIAGQLYHIKKIDSTGNLVTIDANGSETIDGVDTVVISTQYESFKIVSNGTNWFII